MHDRERIRPGVPFDEAIAQGLRSSRAVVALISPGCNSSAHCKAELRTALALGKYVVPVLCCGMEFGQVPRVFSKYQCRRVPAPQSASANANANAKDDEAKLVAEQLRRAVQDAWLRVRRWRDPLPDDEAEAAVREAMGLAADGAALARARERGRRHVWFSRRPAVGHFVGRGAELRRVGETLERRGSAVVVATGIPGVGKSELVARFAESEGLRFDVVAWLRAETRSSLAGDMARLGAELGVPFDERDSLEQRAERVCRWLGEGRSGGALLVFDNADDFAAVRGSREHGLCDLRPRGVRCQTLVTTRSRAGWDLAEQVLVEPLPAGLSVALLRALGLSEAELEGAAELCAAVGQLPLAVSALGGYVKTSGRRRTCASALSDVRAQLASRAGGERETTVSAALATVRRALGPEALGALEELSVVAADGVPVGVLPGVTDGAFDSLHEWNLVSGVDEAATFRVHRLVQEEARQSMSDGRRRAVLSAVVAALGEASSGFNEHLAASWEAVRRVSAHAEQCAGLSLGEPELSMHFLTLLGRMAVFLGLG